MSSNDLIIEIVKQEIIIQPVEKTIVIQMPWTQWVQWQAWKSAYEIAVELWFVWSEEDWLAELELEWQFDNYPHDLALEYWAAKTI
jgi:hypothetical protein